jgi:hypothetical protein
MTFQYLVPPLEYGGRFLRAISSGVERHVDIVEVGGSRPPSPTSFIVAYSQQST